MVKGSSLAKASGLSTFFRNALILLVLNFNSINVTETRSNESSLSSSSIIVMPRAAQSVPTSSASGGHGTSNVSRSEVEEDELSEHGSDASSGSLISVPTSDDEEWASVPSEEPQQAQRYVVLYDDASSQSDNE